MKRRAFTLGALAVPCLLGFARGKEPPSRKTVFEEVGSSVLMTLALPDLVRKTDAEALDSIKSGFDTTLRYELRVWQQVVGAKKRLISERVVVVKIRQDPWKKRYLVRVRVRGGWRKRFFAERDKAIEAATTLTRVKIAAVSDLERGVDGPYYFVEVLAMRNPLVHGAHRNKRASGRASGRDLEWFGRLVEVLAGERAKAEKVVHVRTNPFFLVPR